MVTWTPVRQESQTERKSMTDKMCDSEDMMRNIGSKNTGERERGGMRQW